MARILIVDDSQSQLLGLKRIVEKLGHEVISAEDGAHGVEVAKREIPDLILMDVVMPNLNGFQATRTISKEPKTSHIPIILVTTKDQETDRVWGMGNITSIVKERSSSALPSFASNLAATHRKRHFCPTCGGAYIPQPRVRRRSRPVSF